MRKLSGKKLLTVTLLAATLAFGLGGCGSPDVSSEDAGVSEENVADEADAEESVDTSELKPFRIGAGGADDSPTMEIAKIAYDKGYLEEELNSVGYTVKVSSFMGAGPEINEALAAGELDAAIYGDFPAFTSKSNGVDTTVIALVNGQQQYAVLAANDEIKEAKDLEGKKVIVPQGTVAQYFYEHYVEARGIDASKVEIINATGDALSLLQSGDADAYIMQPSSLSYYASIGLGTIVDTGSDIPEGSTTYLFEVASSVLEESPEVGVAVNKALIRAYQEAVKNPQILYEAVASESLPAEFTIKNYEFDTSLSYMSPEITDDTIQYYKDLNDWLIDHSIISDAVDVDSFVNRSYYEQAVEELGR